jgi:CobQ-like glutamine amidotransferase family enzyme
VTKTTTLRITQFYPELLSIYADRGNVMVLQKRAEWQGIEVKVQRLELGARFDPNKTDLVLMGGGQDRDQQLVANHLREQLPALRDFIERGSPVLAVCGSYQLLGHTYEFELEGEQREIEGLGLLDMTTTTGQPRLVGNIKVAVDIGGTSHEMVGFENHAGRTTLGPRVEPLGRVLSGHGNDGQSRFEGARHLNLIGTYVHGPLLPRNPWLADHLIEWAMQHGW